MIGKKALVVIVVLAWAGVFFGSYLASSAIEGPRNLDTGFKRLDVLAQYQFVALGLAVLAAVLGFVWRKTAARVLLIGLVPLLATALLIAGILVATLILNDRPAPSDVSPPLVPTAPAGLDDPTE
jgi:uncharacterized membrane protein YphA (DoxX/SURF4 family)